MHKEGKENRELKSKSLIKFRGRHIFKKGKFKNISISNIDGEEVLTISRRGSCYNNIGTYISDEIYTDGFTNLILSWNANTPMNTKIEVLARAYIVERNKLKGEWSEYLSWGEWGSTIKSSSSDSECDIAKINTDVFMVNNKDKYKGKKFQIKVKLYSEDTNVTPSISQITATFIDLLDVSDNNLKDKIKVNCESIIDTPCFSQYERDKSIANRICSPTSLTMVLNRLGEDLKVEDVAWNCYDYKYNGFGNWVFNVAFAGSHGYEAYIEYGSFESLEREILKGYPVIVSVRYTNDKNNKEYPYIENSPLTTSGHLIVVCGITTDSEGDVYVVVNDPAGESNETVRRRYKLEEFLLAWSKSNNAMYVVNKKR